MLESDDTKWSGVFANDSNLYDKLGLSSRDFRELNKSGKNRRLQMDFLAFDFRPKNMDFRPKNADCLSKNVYLGLKPPILDPYFLSLVHILCPTANFIYFPMRLRWQLVQSRFFVLRLTNLLWICL